MKRNATITSPLLSTMGLAWKDLIQPEAMQSVDQCFINMLAADNPALHQQLLAYRQGHELSAKEKAPLLIAVSMAVEAFIAKLLGIEEAVNQAQAAAKSLLPVFKLKKDIVQGLVKKRRKEAAQMAEQFAQLDHQLAEQIELNHIDTELPLEMQLALLAELALSDQTQYADLLELVVNWCLAATVHPEAKSRVANWVSFQTPHKLDFNQLIPVDALERHETVAYQAKPEHLRQREGFSLTDQGLAPMPVMDEAQYCVYCHQSGTDYCSKGFLLKKTDPSLGYKKDPHGALLLGCPLEEKISEMNWLYHIGQIIAPLVMVMLDNPMCPATGYRICNDCMKSCIYQKQKPVDIPAVETDVLKRVLALPWGVEIYWLLSQWSPLAVTDQTPASFNQKKVLVMGMGPAGFTLSHYLLRAGYAVVGMDGLKITPLDKQQLSAPIKNYQDLEQDLDTRRVMGFGGVAEYGITSRWNKNFLSLIYLTLVRQQYFQCFGSVRFGGTITIERAWELGFDHLAIAVGAGLPKELPIENSMVNGMRQANDFLMALQLTGASKKDSLASLQIRLPAVVIGGGLTGVDAATELQAYYIRQIEKTAMRYQSLIKTMDADTLRSYFSTHDLLILDEQLQHAAQLQQEQDLAATENRQPNIIKLIRQWGGVSIVYRKSMQESPAYRLNPEELDKALQEGLYYLPHCQPTKVICDQFGDANAVECEKTDQEHAHIMIPAKTILVATGAKPNIAYAFEHRGELEKDGYEYGRYASVDDQLYAIEEKQHCKSAHLGMFTSYQKNNRRVSFLGDTHPTFHGSVVKAIASAKKAFLNIDQLLQAESVAEQNSDYAAFANTIEHQFTTTLVAKKQLKHDVMELVVQAPEAYQHYQPGVIYKLQTYGDTTASTLALQQASESVPLGASLTDTPGQLKFLMQINGVSTHMLAQLPVGSPLVVMGPTGVKATIVADQSVLIIGGLLALTQLESLLPAFKEKNNKVFFFGCFKSEEEKILLPELLEQCDSYDISVADDWQQHSKALQAWLNLVNQQVLLAEHLQVRVVGYEKLLHWIKQQRPIWLDKTLPEQTAWVGSVYGPMQCMLKGVCAQCLQWQIDPTTGKRTKAVYACSWQDQPFEKIDIHNIEERLSQNHMQETLAKLYLLETQE